MNETIENEIDDEEISQDEWRDIEREVIEEFKDFAKRASEENKDFYDRIREDRRFEGGCQWTSADKKNRGDGRAEMTINLTSLYVNAIVNPFNAKPFKFKAIPTDVRYNEDVVLLNAALTKIQNDYSSNASNTSALRDAVVSGIGFTYATIDNSEGDEKIKYYAVEDSTMVIIDPDARGVALEDSSRIAVCDFLPYETAKEKYGSDIVNEDNPDRAALTNFGVCWEVPKDHVAVITYFRKDGHNVQYFRLCGDRIVSYGEFTGLDYLPVFAFTGDRIWVDDKKSYAGIVRKIKTQQKTINYAQSQLIERLAKSPKGFFLTPTESIEGYEEDYQNAEYGTSYILRYNSTDDGGNACNAPQFISPMVQVDDLQKIISTSSNQMSLATGISPNGIVERDISNQQTATEALLRTKSSQSNVSNYIEHAKESIRIAGNVIAQLVLMISDNTLPKGAYDIVVEEGCVSLTKMEEDREKLLSLAQIVPEAFKPLISQQLVAKLDIEGGEKLSQLLYNMLPQELRGGLPGAQEIQAMQNQMQELQAQLQQQMEQNKVLNDQLTQMQLRTESDILLKKMDFAQQLQLRQLDNENAAQKEVFDTLASAKMEEKQAALNLQKQALEAKKEIETSKIQAIEKIASNKPKNAKIDMGIPNLQNGV